MVAAVVGSTAEVTAAGSLEEARAARPELFVPGEAGETLESRV
jgi:hypothetical protein